MKVLLPYPPSVNRIWRRGSNGTTYQPKEIKDFKVLCAWLAKKEGAVIITGEVEIHATLHPKLTKKGFANKSRLDLDNVVKSVFDSFNGVCYKDDKQITKITLEIGDPIDGGGLSVEIKPKT